jgi:hypothetical protein
MINNEVSQLKFKKETAGGLSLFFCLFLKGVETPVFICQIK